MCTWHIRGRPQECSTTIGGGEDRPQLSSQVSRCRETKWRPAMGERGGHDGWGRRRRNGYMIVGTFRLKQALMEIAQVQLLGKVACKATSLFIHQKKIPTKQFFSVIMSYAWSIGKWCVSFLLYCSSINFNLFFGFQIIFEQIPIEVLNFLKSICFTLLVVNF